MDNEWIWMGLCALAMLVGLATVVFDDRQPMTQAQIDAAFAKQVQR